MDIDVSQSDHLDEWYFRELSKLVKPPNGITIDKRVPLPAAPPWVPVAPPLPAPPGQWRCSGCGLTASNGGSLGYVCSRYNCPAGLGAHH